MRHVYLFQPQYALQHQDKINYWLPYSAGCIWSHAQSIDRIKENFQLQDLIFKRVKMSTLLSNMKEPAVCGFSCYVWNEKYCLEAAKQIKELWPNCVIVFGGPQTNSSMLEYEFIDSIMTGEGEENFSSLLIDLLDDNPITKLYSKARLTDLHTVSPFVAGVFDKIINENPDAVWSTVIETNRGCPFQCTFCDWGSATYSKVRKFDIDRVAEDFEWAKTKPIVYITLADANFGIFKERDLEIAKLLVKVKEGGFLESVSVTYTKNSTENVFRIAKELGDLSRGVTISVQSMNENTLDIIKRKNMDINNIRQLLALSHSYGVHTYTEMIIGLPEETEETWKQGLSQMLELGQHDLIDVWPCQVIRNSELNSFDYKVKYGIKTVTAVDYMPFKFEDEEPGIQEEIVLVNQTSMMSTKELVSAYIWSWVVLQFHIAGYTQLFSKYCRNVHGVSYRDFYDTLTELLKEDEVFGSYYNTLIENTLSYFKTGSASSTVEISFYNMVNSSYGYFYSHKERAYDLGKQCVTKFTKDADDIDKIQRLFLLDKDLIDVEITTPWDLHTWEQKPSHYRVTSSNIDISTANLYYLRRKGLLRNTFTKLTK